MRSSTPRPRASLLLFASMVLASGAFAQTPRSNQPAAAAPAGVKPGAPVETRPSGPAKPPAPAPEKGPAAEAKPSGTAATVVNLKTIEGIMGKSVRSRSGNEDMGHIVDILVDDAGQVRAAVIDFGGFLGVGSRKVAVAWRTLDFADSIQSGSVKVSLTRDQVRQAPEYKADEPVVILEGAPSAKEAPPVARQAPPAAKQASPKETPPAGGPAAPSPPAGHIEDSPGH